MGACVCKFEFVFKNKKNNIQQNILSYYLWCLCINVACWWKLNKMLIKTMKNQAKGDRIKRIGTGGWRDTMRGNGQCKRVGINVSASAMQRSKPSRNITTSIQCVLCDTNPTIDAMRYVYCDANLPITKFHTKLQSLITVFATPTADFQPQSHTLIVFHITGTGFQSL